MARKTSSSRTSQRMPECAGSLGRAGPWGTGGCGCGHAAHMEMRGQQGARGTLKDPGGRAWGQEERRGGPQAGSSEGRLTALQSGCDVLNRLPRRGRLPSRPQPGQRGPTPHPSATSTHPIGYLTTPRAPWSPRVPAAGRLADGRGSREQRARRPSSHPLGSGQRRLSGRLRDEGSAGVKTNAGK